MTSPRVACVIMAGGRGERLWPLVRKTVPKVCLRIDGKRSLLETTLARVQGLWPRQQLLIVTTAAQARPIRHMLPRALRHALLVEPQPRNTAACIALAAVVLAQEDPTTIMVALPADHWIRPPAAFRHSLRSAIDVARENDEIVTIGIRPTRVHPGLGHVSVGASVGLQSGCRVFRLRRFEEKPSPNRARRLLASKRVYWNSGIFVGRVTTFLDLIERWLPAHARLIAPLGELAGQSGFQRRATSVYRRLRAISFDHGVMVHLRQGGVVEGNFQWEDVGSWESLIRISQGRQQGVRVASQNSHVISPDGHLVATVGLDHVIVVTTRDATLVCRTDRSQAVRGVVARLLSDRRLARYA